MKTFKSLGIQTTLKPFTGDKIKIDRILNKEITVLAFKIENSKFQEKGSGKCLCLHIKLKEETHVVFTGSTILMNAIQQVNPDDFPFTTVIERINDHYEFT